MRTMGFFSSILNLLFPPKCVFCSKILKDDSFWCSDCADNLLLAADSGKTVGEYFDFCISPLYYTGVVRKSILRFKFRGAASYAEAYGKIMASCIKGNIDVKYDLISWVPLSTKRKKARGYDQAMLLAMATALELDDIAVETLVKSKHVRAQSELSGKDERAKNISEAFCVADIEIIKDKTILLIDDIITTASTLEECAKELIGGGAAKVICVALAKATHS